MCELFKKCFVICHLFCCTHEGTAILSWPGWLGWIPRLPIKDSIPRTVAHLSTYPLSLLPHSNVGYVTSGRTLRCCVCVVDGGDSESRTQQWCAWRLAEPGGHRLLLRAEDCQRQRRSQNEHLHGELLSDVHETEICRPKPKTRDQDQDRLNNTFIKLTHRSNII